jgi:hypothetical protein
MMPDVRIGDCSARGPRRHDLTGRTPSL